MNLQEIKNYIREWLVSKSELTDSQVIFDFQNAPKPTQDFITLNPTRNIRNISTTEQIQNSDGTVTYIQRKEIDMSINCYGSNSESIMLKVLDNFFLPTSYQDFNLNNIVVISNDSIRNLSFIENNQWVKRFQLDIIVKFINEYIEDLGYFESIGISTEIDTDYVREYHDILSSTLEREENNNTVIDNVLSSEVSREENNNDVILNTLGSTIELTSNNEYVSRPIINTDIILNSNPQNTETISILEPVTNLSFSSVTEDSITLTWFNPLNTNQYIILVSLNNFDTVFDTVSGLGNSKTFTSLDSNTTYYFRVFSLSSSGTSAYVESDINTLPFIPEAPIMNSVSNVTSSSLQANWLSVSGVTNYIVEISIDNFVSVLDSEITSNTYYKFTGLIANTEYKLRVRAIGDEESNNSNIITESTLSSFKNYVIDANTLLYYRFQNGSGTNINDETANNRDSTIISTTSWQGGIISNDTSSLYLSGNGNTNTGNFNPAVTDFTARISFRFNTGDKSAKATHILLSRYDTLTGISNPDGADFICEFDPTVNKFIFSVYQTNTLYRAFEASYTVLENTNYSVQFAFKLNNSGSNLFEICVNGVKLITSLNFQNITNITNNQNSTIPLMVGAYRTSSGIYYRGQFRVLRVAFDNDFRTESEALTDYNLLFS
jgi:hypothetical protein